MQKMNDSELNERVRKFIVTMISFVVNLIRHFILSIRL